MAPFPTPPGPGSLASPHQVRRILETMQMKATLKLVETQLYADTASAWMELGAGKTM